MSLNKIALQKILIIRMEIELIFICHVINGLIAYCERFSENHSSKSWYCIFNIYLVVLVLCLVLNRNFQTLCLPALLFSLRLYFKAFIHVYLFCYIFPFGIPQ